MQCETDAGLAGSEVRASPGRPLPLGVHDCSDGFNFAIFSRHAEQVELLIFADMTSAQPRWTFDLDRVQHRTGDIWHVLVEGAKWGQAYAYRVHRTVGAGSGASV